MKKLYIVRHSKAVEYASDHSDFNRCLADSGVHKATIIAGHLAESLDHVDLIFSSPACRALETARIFAEKLHYSKSQIIALDSLYHFGGIDRALKIISETDDSIETLMLFGHNPTFNALAWRVCNDFRDAMPTSAVVGVALDTDSWSGISRMTGKLIVHLTKRNIK